MLQKPWKHKLPAFLLLRKIHSTKSNELRKWERMHLWTLISLETTCTKSLLLATVTSFLPSKQVFKQCDKIFAVLFGELCFKLVFSEIVISYQITVNIKEKENNLRKNQVVFQTFKLRVILVTKQLNNVIRKPMKRRGPKSSKCACGTNEVPG